MEERRIDRGRKRNKRREGDVRERGREIDRGRKRGERVKLKRAEETEKERKGKRC